MGLLIQFNPYFHNYLPVMPHIFFSVKLLLLNRGHPSKLPLYLNVSHPICTLPTLVMEYSCYGGIQEGHLNCGSLRSGDTPEGMAEDEAMSDAEYRALQHKYMERVGRKVIESGELDSDSEPDD